MRDPFKLAHVRSGEVYDGGLLDDLTPDEAFEYGYYDALVTVMAADAIGATIRDTWTFRPLPPRVPRPSTAKDPDELERECQACRRKSGTGHGSHWWRRSTN